MLLSPCRAVLITNQTNGKAANGQLRSHSYHAPDFYLPAKRTAKPAWLQCFRHLAEARPTQNTAITAKKMILSLCIYNKFLHKNNLCNENSFRL